MRSDAASALSEKATTPTFADAPCCSTRKCCQQLLANVSCTLWYQRWPPPLVRQRPRRGRITERVSAAMAYSWPGLRWYRPRLGLISLTGLRRWSAGNWIRRKLSLDLRERRI